MNHMRRSDGADDNPGDRAWRALARRVLWLGTGGRGERPTLRSIIAEGVTCAPSSEEEATTTTTTTVIVTANDPCVLSRTTK